MKITSLFLLVMVGQKALAMSNAEIQRFLDMPTIEYYALNNSRYETAIPYHLYLGLIEHIQLFKRKQLLAPRRCGVLCELISLKSHVRLLSRAYKCKTHVQAVLHAYGLDDLSAECDRPDTPTRQR